MFNPLPFLAPAALGLLFTASPLAAADSFTFDLVVSAGAKACLPNATAKVSITPVGPVEIMEVSVDGLPPKTEFDFFVIQVPKAPFGVAWYQATLRRTRMAGAIGVSSDALVSRHSQWRLARRLRRLSLTDRSPMQV